MKHLPMGKVLRKALVGEEDDKGTSLSTRTFQFTTKKTEIHRQWYNKIQNGRKIKNELCRSGRETTSARELWEDFMMRYKVKRSGCSFEMRYKRRKLWGRENTVGRGMQKQMSRVHTKSSLPRNGACIEANSAVASEGQAVQVRLGWPDAGLPWD